MQLTCPKCKHVWTDEPGAGQERVECPSCSVSIRLVRSTPAPKATGVQMPRVVVYPRPSADGPARLAPDILALVKANPGWELAAMKTLEGRLDDVFRELTEPRN